MADTKDNAQAGSTAKLVKVKFLKGWLSYNKGESAGFSADIADKLIDKKIAAKA